MKKTESIRERLEKVNEPDRRPVDTLGLFKNALKVLGKDQPPPSIKFVKKRNPNPKGRPRDYDDKLVEEVWKEWKTGLWKKGEGGKSNKSNLLKEKFSRRIKNVAELSRIIDVARKRFGKTSSSL